MCRFSSQQDILNSATIPVGQLLHQFVPFSSVTNAMRGLYVIGCMGTVFIQRDYMVKFQLLIRKYLFFADVAPSTVLLKDQIIVNFPNRNTSFVGFASHITLFVRVLVCVVVGTSGFIFLFRVSCNILSTACQVILFPLSIICVTVSRFRRSALAMFYVAFVIRRSYLVAILCSVACAFLLDIGCVFFATSRILTIFAMIIMSISKAFVLAETFNRFLCRGIAGWAGFRQNEQGELDNVIYFIHGKSNLSYRHALGCFRIARVNYLPLLIIPQNPPQKPLYSTSIAEFAFLANKGYQA